MVNAISYDTWNGESPIIDENDGTKGALSALRWAYDQFGDSIVYSCSFGIEGIVLIDLISQVKEDAKIIFLDTGLHFKETYETIEKIQARFPKLNISLEKPHLTLEEQAEEYGEKLWEQNPNLCCQIRKIKPLEKALNGYDAWISGLRREQSLSRGNTNFINKDGRFNKIKVCPLIHWTWKEVWRYQYKHGLPYITLHDQGYPSIGCEPCTVPSNNELDMRAGRWAGHQKVECGLHES